MRRGGTDALPDALPVAEALLWRGDDAALLDASAELAPMPLPTPDAVAHPVVVVTAGAAASAAAACCRT